MKKNYRYKKYGMTISIALLVIVIGVVGFIYMHRSEQSSGDSNTADVAAAAALANLDDDVDWSTLPTQTIELTNDGLSVTEPGTYILSGNTTGNITVDTDGYVRLALDGVSINSSTGSALQIDNAKKTVIQLVNDSENSIRDGATRADESIDGAIYSSDDLVFEGEGKLTVEAQFADGIVSKDSLWIKSSDITVTSVDDGIRGKDMLSISGGTITVNAQGDGLKSTNETDAGEGNLVISGGSVTIQSGDDGIKSEQKVWITGGTINVAKSVEGIEAPVIIIDGGDITVYASDDGLNASASAITTTGLSITINSGTLAVTVGSGDTDAIDSNGDIIVNGGTITITAPTSSFDFDGTGNINGGTVTVNGQTITTMPTQMMGGGAMGGRR
ncbi:carbohydrate-binding domain-containing protein [Candidatus Saccharibacteria bacterium]|nr:carbohydrate-binding domain-containing protein [Candidatus Saccharibacteria bacterium]